MTLTRTVPLTKLPKCPLDGRAFPARIREELGGVAQLAGIDLEERLPKSVKDHPWMDCEVTFPAFADDGFVGGKIVRCIVHPLGRLMFDILWPAPVPPLHGHGYRRPLGWEVVLRDRPEYQELETRMFGHEIVELVKQHPKCKPL